MVFLDMVPKKKIARRRDSATGETDYRWVSRGVLQ
jgi:hypothetical protein